MVKDLRRVGVPVVYDTEPAIFPVRLPDERLRALLRLVRGRRDRALSPIRVSLSARRGRGPHPFLQREHAALADANWVAPLLSKGAAASLGNVYEPYLQLTTHLDIFNDRLLHGFTFAESAYMATRALSWMNVAVGDPLYRPYANWMQIETKRDEQKEERLADVSRVRGQERRAANRRIT